MLPYIETLYRQHQNPIDAAPMVKYMKSKFLFLGLKRPQTKILNRQIFNDFGKELKDKNAVLDLVEALWLLPEREFQYLGVELLTRISKQLKAADLPRIEALVLQKSWWDTVDALASRIVGGMVASSPTLWERMDELSVEENFWLRRVAILCQLTYYSKTDAERLFQYCRANMFDKEFFIRKAIGWALRQYAKTNPQAVIDFVAKNDNELSPLSKKEALRIVIKS